MTGNRELVRLQKHPKKSEFLVHFVNCETKVPHTIALFKNHLETTVIDQKVSIVFKLKCINLLTCVTLHKHTYLNGSR